MKLNIQLFAHTNATTNYELPQFVGTDKPTWLGDFNEAMADIDAGMHENASDIASMASDVTNAVSTASQASQDVTTLTGTVNTLSGTVSSVQTTANNASQTASSALNTANTANGKADANSAIIATNSSDISTLQTKVSNACDYSTTEKVVGTWIDNKPIYRKVINFGALPNNTTKNVAHNISNLGNVINIGGFIYNNNDVDFYSIPLQYKGNDSNYNVECLVTATQVRMLANTDRSFYTAYVILDYTKSTD